MNPPTAEAVRPADSTVHPPEEEKRPEIIAFFQDESGERTPLTKGQVKVVFVEERPHFNHCFVTLEGEQDDTFLLAPESTLVHLLDSDVPHEVQKNMPEKVVGQYATFMARHWGAEPLPELIPTA